MNGSNERLLDTDPCAKNESQPRSTSQGALWLVGFASSIIALGAVWLAFEWGEPAPLGSTIIRLTNGIEKFIERIGGSSPRLDATYVDKYAAWIVISLMALAALIIMRPLARWSWNKLLSAKSWIRIREPAELTADVPQLLEVRWSGTVTHTFVDLWHNRELLYFLVWKDIKVKYKQTALGVTWAILQPLIGMAMFTVLFGRVAKLPSDGLPYPLFYYASMLTWTYFSTAIIMASNSVVNNTSLITKVYFPRILLPAAAVTSALLDLAIASLILCGLLVFYQVPLTLQLAIFPLVLSVLVAFALGVGQILAAVNVKYRDVRHALPFVMQVWLFASPVVYPISMVPAHYQWIATLNPMTGIIETIRAVIVGRPVPWEMLGISCAVIGVTSIFGLWFFKRTERRFADII